MPVQQQNSSFARNLGGRVSQANQEHAGKPVDTGNRRLPAGIREAIAKLSTMYTKQYEAGKSPSGPKAPGQPEDTFFRASAVVLYPEQHNGEKVSGMVTQIIIPLCDEVAKGQKKARTFSENWFEFQNLFKLLGIQPCPETPQTDPTGQRTEAYFFAAMKLLTDPERQKTNPVYITFSTRGWTPAPSPQQPKPTEMVFETWHGLASADQIARLNGQYNPAAGVREPSAPVKQFNEFEPSPQATPAPAPAPTQQPQPQQQPPQQSQQQVDPADLVGALVEAAMNDPEGATEEGQAASAQLEELAWQQGWTKDQTANPPAPYSNDWAGVGSMALTKPTVAAPPATTPITTPQPTASPTIGSKWKFAKRTKDGAKLKNNKGEEFPAQNVEVVTVDVTSNTCTVKTVKDAKPVVDIRTKLPVQVKFEWLEN